METKKITVKSFVGAPMGDQETDRWTKEDWDEYNAYIERVKSDGSFGAPIETNFILTKVPGFDTPIDNSIVEAGILYPKGFYKKD